MSDTRDWDKEMAEIDKIIAATPPAAMAPKQIAKPGGAAPAPSAGTAPVARAAAPSAAGAFVATWFRTGLAVLLAIALPVWPFARYCGVGLGLYLGAVAVAAIASVWAAAASWRHRRSVAHVIALLSFAWIATLATMEILPRIGYAKHVEVWACTNG